MDASIVTFTQGWWMQCLRQPEKLTRWLQKLQRTELGGYTDHLEFMARHAGKLSEREVKILTNVAEDELNHSHMLADMMLARGIAVLPTGEESSYWADVLAGADTFSAYCAANHFGEALAAFRFEVILGMRQTPSDVREVLSRVLPDEIFHRETLARLASAEDLLLYSEKHAAATSRLMRGRA